MKNKYKIIAFIILFIANSSIAQISRQVKISWSNPTTLVMGNDSSVQAPCFAGATYNSLPERILPSYTGRFLLPPGTTTASAFLEKVVYTGLTATDRKLIGSVEIAHPVLPLVQIMTERGNAWAVVSFEPFGIDPASQRLSKIESFTLRLDGIQSSPILKNISRYSTRSVLATGDWYKIYVRESGIYKLTYDDLSSLGISMNGLNPALIRVFGNGGALLNEAAGAGRIDDLAENAVKVVSASPDVFAKGDYILFYGKGTLTWSFNPLKGRMEHVSHHYADDACYFVTIGPVPGKRIQQDAVPAGEVNYYSEARTDFVVYENDAVNLIMSGRKWYGEKFDNFTRTFNLPSMQFPGILLNEPVTLLYGFAGRASESLSSEVFVNGVVVATKSLDGIAASGDFATEATKSATFPITSGNLAVQVRFNPPNSTALGWLDFVALNVRCDIRFREGQMAFCDPRATGADRITSFTLLDTPNGIELWDVTDGTNVKSVYANISANRCTCIRETSELTEMIAFDGTSFLSVTPGGKVPNQNLHATGNYDMIIVTHPDFAAEAQRLAMLHNNAGDVSVEVVSLPEIYNEFSSGIQDITAIRDFMKMLYDRGSASGQPRYLLLFGNASYDVKNRIPDNTSFIPTYQSENSLRPVASFLTDDYFGLLDDGEGAFHTTGLLDVPSGRLPVRTPAQAKIAVDKIERYLNNASSTHGDWRNTLLLIADDENSNTHLDQAEILADSIAALHPVFNVEKIYFDAFKQQSTPGGNRYPDVNREIRDRVQKGALLTNYIGHGGDVGWGHERVLEISDILGWTNYDRMGIFFTATCEFSRFDNPGHTSAGELVFLNPEGGAMSLITTTRLALSSINSDLNISFIDTLLNSSGGEYPGLGDILRFTKNDNALSVNSRQITLLGDPSLRLSYPGFHVVTTAISSDTLVANSLASIQGEIRNENDLLMDNFTGVLNVKVFDKPSRVSTLGQDPESFPVSFLVQKNIIYQGQVSVRNGAFAFSFPVPVDIEYRYGKGKISYYASNGTVDAHGYFDNLIIGGSASPLVQDVTGPEIKLYINDSTFRDGDLTSENPILLVKLYDESGINTVGSGIGHDIMATIDDDSYSSVPLSDYYVADLDSYRSGMVKYQYFKLPDGEHTLTLKAWDVLNNSSSATIRFIVKRNIILAVEEVKAWPNPSAGEVWFSLAHNLFDAVFTADIEIYSLSGALVRTIGPMTITSGGYVAGNLKWDGRMSNGYIARNGLYVCRLRLRDRNGNTTSNPVKVILAR